MARDLTGSDKTITRTTCPRDCYDACGIAVVKRADGAIRVLGDPEHPVSRGALCGKCAIAYNGIFLDPAARLPSPLRRNGAKGSGQFVEISWDAALAEIADRLQAILRDHGPETILHGHYTGTCSLLAGGFPQRFFNRLGAAEIDPDSICNAAGHAALGYLYGSSALGFDPRSAKDAACILVWGANPSVAAPHMHKHWLKETSAKVIVVDPVRHDTAAAAHMHLQPYPGSDAALAFAMLRVMRDEGLVDHAYLAAHAVGWDDVAPLIDQVTLDWASEVTGIASADIVAAARLYGRGPSLLWLGQGLQRQAQGGNIFRAVGLLPAASGNIGKPGAGFCYLNGSGRKGIDGDDIEGTSLRRNSRRVVSHMDLVSCLNDPAQARGLFTWNINIAASNPQQSALHQALRRPDLFHVAIDPFPTDTVDFADIVLPAATFLEFDDIVSPYFDLTLSAQVAALPPMGLALSNQEIFRRLAKAMGFDEPALQEPDAPILDRLCHQAGVSGGFRELAGAATVTLYPEPVLQFADGVFPTPSGKIEITSAAAVADGYPRVPQPTIDQRPPLGWFRLLSPASPWLMNSSYSQDSKIQAKIGPEDLIIHPQDASALGIDTGKTIEVTSVVDSLTMRAVIDDRIPAGIVLAAKSRWPKLSPEHRNVNALNPGLRSDMAQSTAVHSVLVQIRAQHPA
ncbi:MAG TPA: molybdopterin-dependent oxidoreductase [Dongiaceae bacterium]|nr:molybdopterin-dependent oxidoreductase [Dongiaceae bacterium]